MSDCTFNTDCHENGKPLCENGKCVAPADKNELKIIFAIVVITIFIIITMIYIFFRRQHFLADGKTAQYNKNISRYIMIGGIILGIVSILFGFWFFLIRKSCSKTTGKCPPSNNPVCNKDTDYKWECQTPYKVCGNDPISCPDGSPNFCNSCPGNWTGGTAYQKCSADGVIIKNTDDTDNGCFVICDNKNSTPNYTTKTCDCTPSCDKCGDNDGCGGICKTGTCENGKCDAGTCGCTKDDDCNLGTCVAKKCITTCTKDGDCDKCSKCGVGNVCVSSCTSYESCVAGTCTPKSGDCAVDIDCNPPYAPFCNKETNTCRKYPKPKPGTDGCMDGFGYYTWTKNQSSDGGKWSCLCRGSDSLFDTGQACSPYLGTSDATGNETLIDITHLELTKLIQVKNLTSKKVWPTHWDPEGYVLVNPNDDGPFTNTSIEDYCIPGKWGGELCKIDEYCNGTNGEWSGGDQGHCVCNAPSRGTWPTDQSWTQDSSCATPCCIGEALKKGDTVNPSPVCIKPDAPCCTSTGEDTGATICTQYHDGDTTSYCNPSDAGPCE